MILLRIKDCKKTQTKRTNRFCMYLSLMFSQLEIQFEMYKCMNSVGNSTAVVKRFTTSMECNDMSMFTKADKYSCSWRLLLCINFNKHLIATMGLFSTKSGKRLGDNPDWYTWRMEKEDVLKGWYKTEQHRCKIDCVVLFSCSNKQQRNTKKHLQF